MTEPNHCRKLEDQLRAALLQIRGHLLLNRDKQVIDAFLPFVHRGIDPHRSDMEMPQTTARPDHPLTIIYKEIRRAILGLQDYDQTSTCPDWLEKAIDRLSAYGLHSWTRHVVAGDIASGFRLERPSTKGKK